MYFIILKENHFHEYLGKTYCHWIWPGVGYPEFHNDVVFGSSRKENALDNIKKHIPVVSKGIYVYIHICVYVCICMC
jgi:hypothetical protein